MQLLNVHESSSRKRKSRIRLILILVGLAVVIVVLSSVKPALGKYRAWKQERALAQASEFLANNDLPKAKLALDVAFAAVPGNPEALRIAATLLEQAGSPEVLPLRRRLVQITPHSVENRAALVTSSIRFQDYNSARDALRDMSPEQANHPAALKAALAYAMATDNKPVADALYDRVKVFEPDNENLQVMHALLLVRSPDGRVASKARRDLAVLAENPRHSLFIQRELMLNALAAQKFEEAIRLGDLILADSRATFADRLQRANLALNQENRPFKEIFDELAHSANQNVPDTAELIRWTLSVGQVAVAEQWISALGDELKNSPEIAALEADAVAINKDWDRLGQLLESGVWGAVKNDTVKLAFSTRISIVQNNEVLRKQLWNETISSAGKSLNDLRVLHRLAVIWNEEDATEKLLWVITRGFRNEAWSSQALFNYYQQKKDTANLRALMAVLKDQDSTVPRYKYDWALLSLISQRSSGWSPAKTAMHELYTLDSNNASYVTGYAFALAQSEKVGEALVLIDAMSPEDRAIPARAPYLAYIYGMGKRSEEFAVVMATQSQLAQLLPEEEWLFTLGQQLFDRPLPKSKKAKGETTEAGESTTSDVHGAGQS